MYISNTYEQRPNMVLRGEAFDNELKAVGQKVLAKRKALGISHGQCATLLRIKRQTLSEKTKNSERIGVYQFAKFANFLGYCPFSKPTSDVEKLVHFRYMNSLSQTSFGKLVGVSGGTVYNWECCGQVPPKVMRFISKNAKFKYEEDISPSSQ